MTTQTQKEVALFAERLSDLVNSTPIGATATQVRASTVWLRDAYDNFQRLWTYLGLPDSPNINAYRFMMQPSAGMNAFVYQAEEVHPTPEEDEAYQKSIGLVLPHGYKNVATILPIGGGDWFVSTSEPMDPEFDPFVLNDLTLDEFFNGVFMVIDGFAISRFDILNYAAYEMGYIHTNGSRNRKRYAAQIEALDKFRHAPQVFRRPNIEYMVMDISRAIALSNDAQKFRMTANLSKA